MAKMGDFIAFDAAISLLKSTNRASVIEDVYRKCKEQEHLPKDRVRNVVKEIYAPFTDEELSKQIAIMLTPKGIHAEVEIIFQTVSNLHIACPNNLGDWYFTGDYPTPGGNKVVNKAFINWKENRNERAY